MGMAVMLGKYFTPHMEVFHAKAAVAPHMALEALICVNIARGGII